MDALYLLHHKTSWVLEGEIASSYVEKFLLSTSENEVIKIEDLEDEPDECFIFTSDKNDALIKNKNHVSEEPSLLKKGYTCDECEKFFACKSSFNEHMVIHRGEKRFSCNLCEKRISTKSNLRKHMLVHSGKKEFSCDMCDKAFADE